MGPGPVVQHVGGQDGSWLFLFPFSRCDFPCFSFVLSLLLVVWEAHYDRSGWSGHKGRWYIEKPTTATMALRAACSGIANKRSHTPQDHPAFRNPQKIHTSVGSHHVQVWV